MRFYINYKLKLGIILLISFLAGVNIAFSATVSVTIDSAGNFSPSSVTIDAGDTVAWTNNKDSNVRVASDNHSGSEAVQHLNYLDPKCPISGCWDSTLSSGGTYSFNFKIPGTWDYHDHLQPGKKGTIIVRENNVPGTVSNLQTSGETLNSISLTWTAPGDDAGNTGNFGTSTSYDIRYNTVSTTESNWSSAVSIDNEPSPRVAGTSEGVTITGLEEDTFYYFAMKATDEAGNVSQISNVPGLKTLKFGASASAGSSGSLKPIVDSTPPGAIKDLRINNVYENAVEITWRASGDDEYSPASVAYLYEIKFSTSTIGDNNWIQSSEVKTEKSPNIAGLEEKLLINNLEASTTYYFAIKTIDEVGNKSKISNIASTMTLPDSQPPSSIFDLSSVDVTGYSVTLNWTSSSDIGGRVIAYEIRYSKSPLTLDNWTSASLVDSDFIPGGVKDKEELTIFNLQKGITYYFAVKSKDKALNYSSLSNVLKITTTLDSDNRPPNPIHNLSASDVTNNGALFFWTAPGNDGDSGTASLYDMRYSNTELDEEGWNKATPTLGLPIPSKSGFEESMTVLGLSPNSFYHFGIKTYDKFGNLSKISNVVNFKTSPPDIIPPSSVKNLSAVDISGYSANLKWTASGNDGDVGIASVYDMRYSLNPINEENWNYAIQVIGEPMAKRSGLEDQVTVFGLSASTTYYFALKVIDDEGNQSSLSNVLLLNTNNKLDDIPPTKIESLKIKNVSGSIVSLTWKASGNDSLIGSAESYDLRFSNDVITNENWENATMVQNLAKPQIAESLELVEAINLPSSGVYYFAVRSRDSLNLSEISNIVSVEIQKISIPARPKIREQIQFTSRLSFSSRGKEVELLQSTLAKDPEVYKEGLITGYFGLLTKKAVERFQTKYNIVSSGDELSTGYGVVGPKTRIKLTENLARINVATLVQPIKKVEEKIETKAENYIILVEASGFSPEIIRIPLGATVTWVNKDVRVTWIASDLHPTHTVYPEFDQKEGMSKGESYFYKFTRKGTWGFHDHIVSSRVGKIIVE